MKTRHLYRFLAIYTLVIALNAFGGGIYGITGARELPAEWLQHTPFNSYLIPSLFLLIVVGGMSLLTSVSLFKRSSWAWSLSLYTGILLVLWIIVQVAMIGYVSWLQPAIFISGLVICSAALKLPKA